jgi:hypothetical protein
MVAGDRGCIRNGCSYAFEPGLASFGLDGVLSESGCASWSRVAVRTRDGAQREAVLRKVLHGSGCC